MTSKEFIESGMLELYVLGSLSDQEKAEVERMCQLHPEVKAELDAVESAMEHFDAELGIAPPPELKARLFTNLSGTSKEKETPTAVPVGRSFSWPVAASVTIALISFAVALFYFQKYSDVSGQYEALVAQNTLMAQELNEVKNSLDQNQQLLSLATDESTQRITLNATQEGSGLQVFVYWNTASQEVYLDPGNLTMPGDQQDYQLWAIVGGQPVDMGVLDFNDPEGLQKMKSVQGAVAFAITLEPKGGRDTPTLENMLVLGQVSA